MIIFITPSIALASWWNPFSWKVFSFFKKKQELKQEQVIEEKTSEEKIEELQKQLDELKGEKENLDILFVSSENKEVKKTPVINKPKVVEKVVDVCDEIDGTQEVVPLGYVKYGSGPYVSLSSINKNKSTEILAQEQANKEGAEIQKEKMLKIQEELLLAEIKKNCTDVVNNMKLEIIAIKEKYYIDKEELISTSGRRGVTSQGVLDGQISKLLSDSNTEIQILNNEIEKKQLECSIKYGN